MHLGLSKLILLIAAAAAGALADMMVVNTWCLSGGTGCNSGNAYFITAFGFAKVDASDGCRATAVPGLHSLCVDWSNFRAHFYFDGQGKRCLVMSARDDGYCGGTHCDLSMWTEVGCSWRVADPGTIDDGSNGGGVNETEPVVGEWIPMAEGWEVFQDAVVERSVGKKLRA